MVSHVNREYEENRDGYEKKLYDTRRQGKTKHKKKEQSEYFFDYSLLFIVRSEEHTSELQSH